MASKLLKTLLKIDDERKNMIQNIKDGLGLEISENASFGDISQYIGTYTQDFSSITNTEPRLPAWERPKEWPDCHSILRNAESVDGYQPLFIVLLNTDADTTTFPAPGTDYWGNTVPEPVKYANSCRRLVLSDGTIYDNVTTEIVHTWDKTKDIVITDGDFKGTYRWFMPYEKNSSPKYLTFAGLPVAEILIGRRPSGSWSYCNWIVGYTTDTANATLINFEVLPEYDLNTIGVGSIGMSNKCFAGCSKLRHFALGSVTQFSPSSTNGSSMNGWTNIVSIDCPNCAYTFANILPTADSLQYLSSATSSLSIGVSPQLKEIYAPSGSINIATIDSVPGYIREDAEIDIKGFYYNPPIYWTSNRGYKTYTSGGNVLAKNHYNLRIYDATTLNLSGCLVTTSGTAEYSFKNCPNLREFIIPNNWQNRLNMSNCKLNYSNVLEIIDNLCDLREIPDTIYNPTIKFSEYNKSQLTEADIKIATDKGWVIE